MTSKVSIVSQALMHLGHAPISSFDGGDSLVVSAETMFDNKVPSILANGNFRFAIQISQLSELQEPAPYPWRTRYLLPAGYLKTIRLYPNIYNWDIYANKEIYTTSSGEIYMEYVFMPDVSMFPAHFADWIAAEIAAPLALSNADKADYYPVLKQEATRLQAICNAIESSNRPNYSQKRFPVLDQRQISGFIGNSING